jgi:hypothetical protein
MKQLVEEILGLEGYLNIEGGKPIRVILTKDSVKELEPI